jgi:hypothetical protein
MRKLNDTIQLESKELIIHETEYLIDAFIREGYDLNAIPTNCIFDKTLPGLGATHSEIEAKRNSIIIEPNVPVIEGKVKGNSKLLGVYEGINDKKIKAYFDNTVQPKKILCTPEGYLRVKNVAEVLNVNIHEDYFMLFDECEKITQDIDYRTAISLPIKDFFEFKNKAFVSATPVSMRNSAFQEHGFFKLKIKPEYEYRKKLRLITTNHYQASIISLLEELINSESDCICIFMNSTNGINKLINLFDTNNIHDYKAFSSKKSEIKFKERGIANSYESLDLPLAKFNFFTSRFFSAVDIFSDRQPDIIILTDLFEAKYSRVDPFTNAIQIYGRFRKTFPDGNKFRSLTHITNYADGDTVLNESEIVSYYETSEKIFSLLKEKLDLATSKGEKAAYKNAIDNAPLNQFLDEDGTLNYFKVDNFFDDERVKSYYVSANKIHEAYISTGHFFPIEYCNEFHVVGDKELLRYKRLPSAKQRRAFIVKQLDAIFSASTKFDQKELDLVKNNFLKIGEHVQQEEASELIKAYDLIGSEAIKGADYLLSKIRSLVNAKLKELEIQKMFSKGVRDAIHKKFPQLNNYHQDELFAGFKDVFQLWGITAKVNIATVKKYYGADKRKGKGMEGFISLNLFKPDFEFD